MATQQQQEAIYQEGRIELAIQAYKLGQFQTPTAFLSSISLLTGPNAPRSEMPPSHVILHVLLNPRTPEHAPTFNSLAQPFALCGHHPHSPLLQNLQGATHLA